MAITKEAVVHAQDQARTTAIERRLAALEAARRRQNVAGGAAGSGGTTPRVVVGWNVPSGDVAADVTPLVAALRAATISQCVLTVTASDAATDLTFNVSQNGTSIFAAPPTVPHGSARGSQFTFSLSSASLPVAFKDQFGLSVTAGSSSWEFSLWVQ